MEETLVEGLMLEAGAIENAHLIRGPIRLDYNFGVPCLGRLGAVQQPNRCMDSIGCMAVIHQILLPVGPSCFGTITC